VATHHGNRGKEKTWDGGEEEGGRKWRGGEKTGEYVRREEACCLSDGKEDRTNETSDGATPRRSLNSQERREAGRGEGIFVKEGNASRRRKTPKKERAPRVKKGEER